MQPWPLAATMSLKGDRTRFACGRRRLGDDSRRAHEPGRGVRPGDVRARTIWRGLGKNVGLPGGSKTARNCEDDRKKGPIDGQITGQGYFNGQPGAYRLARIFHTPRTERRLGVGLAGSFRPKPAASRRPNLSAFRAPRETSGLESLKIESRCGQVKFLNHE